MLGAGDVGDAPAAERRQVLRRERGAALVVGEQAEARRGRRPGRRRRRPAGHRASGPIRLGRRSARRAVTTRPSTRLPSSWSRCWRSRAGSSVALHMKTAMRSSASALLERLDDREGEAAEAVVGDDADGARLAAVQALGEVVRPEAELALRRAMILVAGLLAAGVPELFSAFDAVPMLTPAAARRRGWSGGRARCGRDGRVGLRDGLVHLLHRAAEEARRRSISAAAGRSACRG